MKIIEIEVTGSTQKDAIKLAETDSDTHLTVIWAHKQTDGVGRHNRKWESGTGNVLWSIILRPQDNWRNSYEILFVNALAVRQSIVDVIGQAEELKVKWPNDIILNDKKLAGSLINCGGPYINGAASWVVVGTGINVTEHPEGKDMLYPPTSLHNEGFSMATKERLIERLNTNLQLEINRWIELGFAQVKHRYLEHAHKLNCEITVGLGKDKSTYRTGIYRGITDEGILALDMGNGILEHYHAEDVILKV